MTRFYILPGAALLMLALTGASFSQTAPAKRAILQQADVAGAPAQQTIFGKVEIAPGSGNPFHTHFGTEMGYVVAGHIRFEIRGETPRELGPGDSFLAPRGAIHRSVPVGDQPVTLISTWTVDKDKPLLTPAP